MFNTDLGHELALMFLMLDPFGSVTVSLAVTAGLGRQERLRVAVYAAFAAFCVLSFFALLGGSVLDALGIPIAEFQFAGSLVLLAFGLQMTLGKVSQMAFEMPAGAGLAQRAVFPLATPAIAGPGAILTVVLLANNLDRSLAERVHTILELGCCVVLLGVLLASAVPLGRLLGRGGIEICVRVFGMVVSTIAVNNFVTALKVIFRLG